MAKQNDCNNCPYYHEYYNCYDGDSDIWCDCGCKKRPCSHSMIMRLILAIKTLIKEAVQELSSDICETIEEYERFRLGMTEEEYFESKYLSKGGNE